MDMSQHVTKIESGLSWNAVRGCAHDAMSELIPLAELHTAVMWPAATPPKQRAPAPGAL